MQIVLFALSLEGNMRSVVVSILFVLLLPHGRSTLLAQELPVPRYDLAEKFRIVSDESSRERTLTRVGDVTVLSSGSIALAQPADRVIRLYDSSGKFLRTIGSPGQVPGEFVDLNAMGSIGDTIWALDWRSRRVSYFREDGRFIRSLLYEHPQMGGSPGVLLALPKDELLVFVPHRASATGAAPAPGSKRDSVSYAIANGDGVVLRHILTTPPDPARTMILVETADDRSWIEQPFLPRVLYASPPGGHALYISTDPGIVAGPNSHLRIHEYRAAGDLRIVDIPVPNAPLADREIDSLRNIKGYVARPGEPPEEMEAMRRAYQQQLYLPDYPPITTELLAGRDGSIWIRQFRQPRAWLLLSQGKIRGQVVSPEAGRLVAATADRIWVLVGSPSEIQTLVVYDLRPAG